MTPPRRILFLDPFSGISGDMFVGALLDLGVDLARLTHEIAKLDLAGYQLSSKRVFRGAMTAIKFDVEIAGVVQKEFDAPESGRAVPAPKTQDSHEHGHEHAHEHSGHYHSHDAPAGAAASRPPSAMRRSFREIRTLIQNSRLSERVKASSIAAFQKLADAEARIHNMPSDDVAFHEVGALDSIIDFVAVCAGLELLGIEEVWCAPLALGSGGFVKCDHGLMPVPAPATLELVKGVPLRNTPIEKELTTPTGAALVAALSKNFCAVPKMRVEQIGYGAGSRERQAVPNVLRALLGVEEPSAEAGDSSQGAGEIVEIRANIDDATPETLAYLSEALFTAGAVDVFFTPIQMKKNRPGTLVTVLAEPNLLGAMTAIFFKESSTFGVRYQNLKRQMLSRETLTVETLYGKVRVKIGRWCDAIQSVHPEYDDCRALAVATGAAIKDVMSEAQAAARRNLPIE